MEFDQEVNLDRILFRQEIKFRLFLSIRHLMEGKC